jgi:RNA polymerase sigma-70 factor (ECF subfamily)
MTTKTEHIWQDLSDQLFNFRLKTVKSKDIAEDMLQDVFLKIHLKISSHKGSDKLVS